MNRSGSKITAGTSHHGWRVDANRISDAASSTRPSSRSHRSGFPVTAGAGSVMICQSSVRSPRGRYRSGAERAAQDPAPAVAHGEGKDYLPSRPGTATGVTLGLAVSIGGLFAPVLGAFLPDPAARGESTADARDRKSTRLNSSHGSISYAVFCLK